MFVCKSMSQGGGVGAEVSTKVEVRGLVLVSLSFPDNEVNAYVYRVTSLVNTSLIFFFKTAS